MRHLVRVFLPIAAALCEPMLLATGAAAFPITATISFVGTGTFGSTAFTDGSVTVSAQFTSESFHACDTEPSLGCNGGPPLFGPEAPVFTVAVNGVTGTRQGAADVSVMPGQLDMSDIEGHLYLNVQSPEITAFSLIEPFGPVTGVYTEDELGANCPDPVPGFCPVTFDTDRGALVLDSIAGIATGSVMVGQDTTVTPEPGTWAMVGTGLLGAAGLVRRRFRQ